MKIVYQKFSCDSKDDDDNLGMNNPKNPFHDSDNRILGCDDSSIKKPSFSHKSIDIFPARTASIKTKDSQIQIVRRNIGEEPVLLFILYKEFNFL